MRISRLETAFERLDLSSPFGFKGQYVRQIWQTAVLAVAENNSEGVGLGVQSPLWSDGRVFSEYGENASNCLMFLLTERAVHELEGTAFDSPRDALTAVLPKVHDYAKRICLNDDVALTFALNALVAVDTALWQLLAREAGIAGFDELIPSEFRPAFPWRHERLSAVPLISYGLDEAAIAGIVEQGSFFLKIKIGADPDNDGNVEKMLDWDKARLSAIHRIAKDVEVSYTDNGRIAYYLDANGRYPSKDELLELIEHAEQIGALDRIVIVEEPFPESVKVRVDGLPVRVAADESAHSAADVEERIALGYGAIALKPIAKTLSVTLEMAKVATESGVPCFCADLTVSPIMIDWNKNVAARLGPLPGLKVGVLESNGHQSYRDWEVLKSYHPRCGAPWTETRRGLFELDEDFYRSSGGIFETSAHYRALFA